MSDNQLDHLPARRAVHRLGVLRLALTFIVLAVIVAWAVDAGLRLRRYAWDSTHGVRFENDVRNGWRWGNIAGREGLFAFYDVIDSGQAADAPARRNDYTPLRITVMTAWVKWTQTHFPGVTGWRPDYAFTAPLLNVNTTAVGVSAVLVFVIIVVLRRRRTIAFGPPGYRPDLTCGVAAGLFGALLMWFNPVIIWDGHCWPQWDVWLMPFFVGAILAACVNAWFVAGVCVVIGAFLKGQMLLVAPVFLLWPILGGRFGAAYRLICGLVFAVAFIAMPWMQFDSATWRWCAMMLAAFAVLMPVIWVRRLRWYWPLAIGVTAMLLAWPWNAPGPAFSAAKLLVLVPLAIVTVQGGLPWRLRPQGFALAAGICVLLTMAIFNASTTWFTMGFVYGTEKYSDSLAGSTTWNLPSILVSYLDWDRGNPNRPVAVYGVDEPVRLRVLLESAYGVTLALCGIAAAWQSRRRDTRLLVAVTLPWLWCFLLMPQMRGRYTVWAAGAGALLAGEGVGLALLGALVSIVGTLGIIANQYNFEPNYDPETLNLLLRFGPHLGWVLLTAAVVQTGVALTPRPRPIASVSKQA